ncbi:hypothetical protein GIB67_029855 [Kingdonia uniflora]|uniref:DUF7875 domain-containing protein n=1 Tax=Kingdonia uniflora TaxID=39325 RepID=A0A7J7NJ67_9MAGN|nr:hypothetical protein GIB67_029855 [Kingdonia uniflora]
MALRRFFGFSEGELCRADAKPCSRLMRHTAGVFTVGGSLAFWILCKLHYACAVKLEVHRPVSSNSDTMVWAMTGRIAIPKGLSREEIYPRFGHPGPRVTIPRSLRWASCGAVSVSASTALLVRLFSPECEPQNIAAYDKGN